MSLETDLFALLAPLVAGRAYPDVGPEMSATPYITWQQVGGNAAVFLEAVVPSKQNARMQINVWASTRLEAKAIALAIEAALTVATAFQAKPLAGVISIYEPETKLRGTRQDFSIWASR